MKTNDELIQSAIIWIAWARENDLHSELSFVYLNIAIQILELALLQSELKIEEMK